MVAITASPEAADWVAWRDYGRSGPDLAPAGPAERNLKGRWVQALSCESCCTSLGVGGSDSLAGEAVDGPGVAVTSVHARA